MPYKFLPPSPQGVIEVQLWPHRSLTRAGFVGFIGLTAALIALPLVALIGKPVLWALLPFLVAAVAGIWFALRKSERDREILEVLTLSHSRTHLSRTGPRGVHKQWEANTYWLEPVLHRSGGPVPNYLTLRGGPREVELGAFLTEQERVALHRDLSDQAARISRPMGSDRP